MIPSRSFSDLYINDFDSVKDFYNLHFTNIFNLPNSYLSTINNNLTKNLINEIKNYNQNINSGKIVLDNIDKLNDKKCLTIITGQQPGLLTGPLYTIYKGLTAVKLANHLSKIYHRNVIPIFWVASEDHDFKEVNGIKWITKENELKEFTFSPTNYERDIPDYKIQLNGNLNELFSEIFSTTYNTEYKEVILSDLINYFKASKTFDEFFCRILAIIFQGYGLIILPSHLTEMRKLASPIIRKEIENPLSSTKLVMKSGDEINKKGLKSALKRIGNEVNFFFIQDNIRRKVTYDSKGFKIEGVNKKYNKEQLIKELDNHPEKFSPNVILRPIIQEFIFPNLAYIAGPGEISYHAQLKEVFKLFNVRFPILYPRKNILILEPSVSQSLKKYNVDIKTILDSPKSLIKIVLNKSFANKKVKRLEKTKNKLISILKDLEKESISVDIQKQVDDINKFIIKGFEKIDNFIRNSHKRENEIVHRQINKINASLFPNRKPQERALNIIQFLIKYGYGFIKMLHNVIDLQKTDVIILNIKSELDKMQKEK